MTPTLSLAHRHAVVTGAGQGIGAAIALALAAQGARLTLMGRRTQPLAELAERIGAQATVVAVDVGDEGAVREGFERARAAHGAVELLVNNAGQAESAAFVKTDLALWHHMLAVNLTGTFLCTREALPDMLARGRGRVVNIASTAGQRGYAYVGAYVAAKHGVVGLTRSVALEVADQGVTVNAVCPGYTDTALLHASISNVVATTGRTEAQARHAFEKFNPQRRIVQPDEVAHAVLWLCSDEARSVTGQSISVSGGEVM